MKDLKYYFRVIIVFILIFLGLVCFPLEDAIEKYWVESLRMREFSTPTRLDGFPPSGEWTPSQLIDFDSDKVLDILLYSYNGSLLVLNGSGNILSTWTTGPEFNKLSISPPIAYDFLNLGVPQVVTLGMYSEEISLMLFNNQGVLLQAHPVEFPVGEYSRLILLPQKNGNPASVCLWAKPISHYYGFSSNLTIPPTVWVYSPSANHCNKISLPLENNTLSFILPDYNDFFQQWELFILSTNATIFRYTLLGDLINTFSHPSITNTPSAFLFSLPVPNSQGKSVFCLNTTGEIVAWLPSGEIRPEWTINLSAISSDGVWSTIYPLLADITKDGKLEVILVGKRPNTIFIFDYMGTLISGWPQIIDVSDTIVIGTVPVIMDVNQDGLNELLLSMTMGNIFNFFDFHGNFSSLWDQDLPDSFHQDTDFLIGDITGDNRCELIYSSMWRGVFSAVESGWVGHAPWPQQRGPLSNIFWDSDLDGLQDDEESFFGTNITSSDTDEDGLSDYMELVYYLTDPCDSDSDNDLISDGYEIQHELHPLCPDINYNGIIDGLDPFPHISSLPIIGIGIIVLGFGLCLMNVLQLILFQIQKHQKSLWHSYLQENHLGSINITHKAKLFHLSGEIAESCLKELLDSGSIIGLYNPEKKLFVSEKTIEWWLANVGTISLKSLTNTLDLPFEEVEHQIHQINHVSKDEWVIKMIDDQFKALIVLKSDNEGKVISAKEKN